MAFPPQAHNAHAHGSSLVMKPQRPPHATDGRRDAFGRLMPGMTLEGAAPPFTGQPQAQTNVPPMPMPPVPMASTRSKLTPPVAQAPAGPPQRPVQTPKPKRMNLTPPPAAVGGMRGTY